MFQVLLLALRKWNYQNGTLASGSNVLIVDDFLKAGGTINGMRSLIQEFDSATAGAVVFCESGGFKPQRNRLLFNHQDYRD